MVSIQLDTVRAAVHFFSEVPTPTSLASVARTGFHQKFPLEQSSDLPACGQDSQRANYGG